jgi:endonuclease G
MVTQPDPARVEGAIAALGTVRRQWLRREGVTAVDVGFKISDGEITDTVALRVHVAHKRPVAELAASEVLNDADHPRDVEGYPVDVIEASYGLSSGPIVLEDVGVAEAVDRRTRIRPILGGISVGNPRITAGTLGAVVFHRTTCQTMILSNFHVLAGALSATAGEEIHQPGRLDGGMAGDRVATLSRFRIDSGMDAAVATIDPGVTFDRELLGVGTITGTTTPTLGMEVVKSGRTTAITRGIIDGVSLTVSIDYGRDVGVVTLTDQIHLVPRPPWPAVDAEVSMGGDSGSIWLEEATMRAIGLHFAGETDPTPSAENGICTPIERVTTEFDISFLPVICRPRPPLDDFCRRFPRLCELIGVPPLIPFPLPAPGPTPIQTPGPVPLPHAMPAPRSSTPQVSNNGGPWATWDDQARGELAQLIAELARNG